MKYMGSKNRISKEISVFINDLLTPEMAYVELFCGGCNLIDKIDHPFRIANDINAPLIALFKALQKGWKPPELVTKEEYYAIRNNFELYDDCLIGYACFCCSYSGKPFSGYAGIQKCKDGTTRNYQEEAIRNIQNQILNLRNVVFENKSYDEITIPPRSLIYCDPPYKNTTGYRVKFDHEKFYDYCRQKVKEGKIILISEYAMPEDFVCVWQKTLKSSLSQNGMYASEISISVEKLFVHKSQSNLSMLF